MAINGTHTVEPIEGVRCTLIEKDISASRVSFLKQLLEFNGYTVKTEICLPPVKKKPAGDESPQETPPTPELFKIGVTDITFNIPYMIYSRALKIPNTNKFVQPSYWNQEEKVSYPYWNDK